MSDLTETSEKLYSAFSKAEGAVKDYEHLRGEIPIPSVNELRYAGCHAIQAIKNGLDESEDCKEFLDRAIRHAKRAYYDVLEFDRVLVAERVDAIQNSYAGYEYLASAHVPNYHDHIKKIHEISRILGDAHELDKESSEYVEKCRSNIEELNSFIDDFISAEQSLFAHIQKEEEAKKEKKYDRKISWLQCIISVIAGVILGSLVTYFFFTK